MTLENDRKVMNQIKDYFTPYFLFNNLVFYKLKIYQLITYELKLIYPLVTSS